VSSRVPQIAGKAHCRCTRRMRFRCCVPDGNSCDSRLRGSALSLSRSAQRPAARCGYDANPAGFRVIWGNEVSNASPRRHDRLRPDVRRPAGNREVACLPPYLSRPHCCHAGHGLPHARHVPVHSGHDLLYARHDPVHCGRRPLRGGDLFVRACFNRLRVGEASVQTASVLRHRRGVAM
jgi:hypothetical protein